MSNRTLKSSGFQELLLFVLRRRWRVRVTGNSMLPLLKQGDEVLVNKRVLRQRRPTVDEIVVCQHPVTPGLKIIKRVQSVAENGSCFVVGDNLAESSDSRQFGLLSAENILGIVTSRF